MIVVFGSINLDLAATVERLPSAGETRAGHSFSITPGGKGANQALAARRAGSSVAIYGAVGRDAFADPALALLRKDGVDVSNVRVVDLSTGVALIHVDAQGENAITVVAGANAQASADWVPDAALDTSTIVVMQFEVPLPEVEALARRAHANAESVGIPLSEGDGRTSASTDFGNVSQRFPSFALSFAISETPVAGHSLAMAAASSSELAHARALQAAKILALTALDVLEDGELLRAARADFELRSN